MRLLVLLGWALVCLGKVDSDTPIPGELGDSVVLKPSTVPEKISSITWKYGSNLAVQWDGTNTKKYRHFEERGLLDVSTGALTIRNLMLSDSNQYTPEINNILQKIISLKVYAPVPKPQIEQRGTKEKILTCKGDTTNAEPVSYSWSADTETLEESSNTITISKDQYVNVNFTCTMKNPVSTMTSEPIIPFPKLTLGYLALLLIPVGVTSLMAFHRFKTGKWFYQKGFKFWTSDFWKSSNESGNDANAETKRMAEDAKD